MLSPGIHPSLFPVRFAHRFGGFQPPCPEAHVGQVGCSRFFKRLRETSLFAASSSIRKCGSRAVTALVGCGAKPRRSPCYGLR